MNKVAEFPVFTAKSYLAGYLLAMLLTAIPFALVAAGRLAQPVTLTIIAVFAILQILVHLRYFLHLKLSRGSEWQLIALVFTGIIMLIAAAGTIWIMSNLTANMTP